MSHKSASIENTEAESEAKIISIEMAKAAKYENNVGEISKMKENNENNEGI